LAVLEPSGKVPGGSVGGTDKSKIINIMMMVMKKKKKMMMMMMMK
jgi:hypothetical protein